MKVDVLVAEIGSTTTVVNAFHGLNDPCPQFLGQGQAPTSVLQGDVCVGLQGAIGCPAALKAVVYINIGIAGAVQPFGHHKVGLPADKAVADMHAVGVPRAPPHHGRHVVTALRCGDEGGNNGEGLEEGSF